MFELVLTMGDQNKSYQVTNGWGVVKLDDLFSRGASMAKPDWFTEKVWLNGGSPANETEIDKTQVTEKKKKFKLFGNKDEEQTFFISIDVKTT
jgi:hypothetical protein